MGDSKAKAPKCLVLNRSVKSDDMVVVPFPKIEVFTNCYAKGKEQHDPSTSKNIMWHK